MCGKGWEWLGMERMDEDGFWKDSLVEGS